MKLPYFLPPSLFQVKEPQVFVMIELGLGGTSKFTTK